jgi:acyl-coenzyme A synthetase/AMP-(fatty) acid ligase
VEVENALASHPAVKEVMAIACPHDTLQEVVGVVIATQEGQPRPGLTQLQVGGHYNVIFTQSASALLRIVSTHLHMVEDARISS